MLRVDVVPAAGAGEAGEDGGGLAAALVADEQAVLSIQHDPLALAFLDIVVDGHGAVAGEDV